MNMVKGGGGGVKVQVSDFDHALSDESTPCPESKMGSTTFQFNTGEILRQFEVRENMRF